MLLFLVCHIFLFSEAPGSQKAAWKGRIAIIDGIEVVKNPDNPIFGDYRIDFAEELSLGEERGGEEYMFSRISGIAADDDGRIYVLDYAEAHIKIFDREGNHLKTIGNRGQGPGEMASPFSLSLGRNGEIAIQDLNNRQILFFSREGDHLRDLSIAEWIMVGIRLDSKHNIVALVSTLRPQEQILELIKFDPELRPRQTICEISVQRGRSGYDPFGPDLYWTLTSDDHVVCGHSKEYELQVYNPQGKLVRKILKDHRPLRIAKIEIDKAEKRLPIPAKLETSKFHSAFKSITADEKNRIYVQTWMGVEGTDGTYFDIFDLEGRYTAKVPLPFTPVLWKGGKVYAVEEDDNGFQVVKRYNVDRAADYVSN